MAALGLMSSWRQISGAEARDDQGRKKKGGGPVNPALEELRQKVRASKSGKQTSEPEANGQPSDAADKDGKGAGGETAAGGSAKGGGNKRQQGKKEQQKNAAAASKR